MTVGTNATQRVCLYGQDSSCRKLPVTYYCTLGGNVKRFNINMNTTSSLHFRPQWCTVLLVLLVLLLLLAYSVALVLLIISCLFSGAGADFIRTFTLPLLFRVQIIDFGLSRFEETNEFMTTRVGTPYCEKIML